MPATTHVRLAAAAATALLALAAPAARAVTTPQPLATSTTLSASRGAVHHGAAVRLVTTVTGQLGPRRGVTVRYYKRAPGGRFVLHASATTDAHGHATLTYHAGRTLEWQARYAGSVLEQPSASRVRTVRVLPPPPPPATPARGERAVRIAAAQAGKPYRYGATGPDAFDCSGLTLYVYRSLGVSLPRTAQEQYDAVPHVPRSQVRDGDLVFFGGSGGISHVGIYAGHGTMWDASNSNGRVVHRAIWTSDYLVGRPR